MQIADCGYKSFYDTFYHLWYNKKYICEHDGEWKKDIVGISFSNSNTRKCKTYMLIKYVWLERTPISTSKPLKI